MSTTDQIERDPLPPGTELRRGAYRIERMLGRGGFALAYLARQGRWNLSVCIKEFFPLGCARSAEGIRPMTPRADERFRTGLQTFNDEAAVLGRFYHPGIVRVLGSFTENGTAYLVQEVLQGITLSDGLTMAGKMKLWNVMRVAQQVGQALLMVHAAGLVHSDLKPENIFITREGRYVLLDFGLTRGFLSASGAEIGGRGLSAGYSPPEQYIPGQTLTPATDVYGFAATLYCLLTGMAPPDAHQRSLGQPLPALRPMNRTITTRVQRALQNALALDLRQRTPGIREFLHELGLDHTPKAVGWRPAQFRPGPTVFRAHPTGITTMALHSPTGRLYSGGRDGTLKVWSWPGMEALGSVPTHSGAPISALAVSQDGMWVVSGSERGEIKLQPTGFDHPGLVLNGAGPGVNALAFHGNNLVAAARMDGACCLYGPTLPQPVQWVAHAGSCNAVDFQPRGDVLATVGDDKVVRMWEFPEPKVIFEFQAHDKSIQCLQFSPDGTSLLTASQDMSLKFWDLQGDGLIREMRGHQAVVCGAAWSSLPKTVISLAGDHCLRAFHLSSSRMAFCSDVKNERTRALAVDPYRPLVATGAKDGGICLWEFSDQVEREAQQEPTVPEEAAAAEEPEDTLIGNKLGHYMITGLLGSGGMAKVYKAVAVGNTLAEPVAIKVIRPDHVSLEFQQRFDREIQLSYKLDHPNVLRTLDWGRETNLTYLVMEYVEGLTLKQLIPPGGMQVHQAVLVLQGIVAALAHAHSLGIVHRDLKPENVMVAHDGRVLLMDFGLARDREVTTVTRPGSAIGTAEYMAPEQVLRGPNRSGLTDKTDQYALGVLAFELLTGRRPFEWDDPVKLITMHLTQEPPGLTSVRPDLPVAVEAVIARMLRKEVDERFASVTEAGAALFEAMALVATVEGS